MGRKEEKVPRQSERYPAFLDRGDPNYDSEEDTGTPPPTAGRTTEACREVEGIASEFLSSKDGEALVTAVEELPSTRTLDDFVARLLRLSMDRGEAERRAALEGVAKLKSLGILGEDQVSRGFDKIGITIDDVKLDVPQAAEIFLNLVDQAIEQKTLGRSFFFRLPETLLKQAQETSDMTRALLEELRNFKRRARGVVEEVFAGQGAVKAPDVEEELMSGNFPHGTEMRHEFVKIAVVAAMDKSDNEREMISGLFVDLGNFLSEGDFIRAFARLIAQIDDIKLDVPDVNDLLARFLFRALADDLLPAGGFLDYVERLRLGGEAGRDLVARVRDEIDAVSDQRRASGSLRVRASAVWTGATETRSKETQFKNELKLAISEFFDSHDAGEFVRLLSEWEMDANRAGEVVRKLLITAMEKSGTECQLVVKLILKAVNDEKLLSVDDVISGFKQIESRIDDIRLDIPDVAAMLASFKAKLKLKNL